eukprot:COSAG04_NODE_22863_length_348_cov_0.614458_1_plen_39_part_10
MAPGISPGSVATALSIVILAGLQLDTRMRGPASPPALCN